MSWFYVDWWGHTRDGRWVQFDLFFEKSTGSRAFFLRDTFKDERDRMGGNGVVRCFVHERGGWRDCMFMEVI